MTQRSKARAFVGERMLRSHYDGSWFRVCCLGPFRLIDAESGIDKTPASRKTRALLGYLAVSGKAIARERLASLLWGDRGDEQARASLRQALYELRSMSGSGQLLKAERDTVAIGDIVTTDISAITQASACRDLEILSSSLADWRGDLLEDLPSIDPSFDGWLQGERLRVHDALIDAAVAAVKTGMEAGQIDPARKVAGLLQQRDATNEIVLRLCLTLDRMAGDTAVLYRRYGRFRELLKSEFGATPSPETHQLFQKLSAVALTGPPSKAALDFADIKAFSSANTDGGQARTSPLADQLKNISTTTGINHPPKYGVRFWAAGLLAVLILLAAGWTVWALLHKTTSVNEAPMLAVMPFQNLSNGSDARLLRQSLALQIARGLVRKKIQVAAMPSEMGLMNTGAPKSLSVTHVLSGSVENKRGRVHVIAQLMDIRGDRVVWNHSYDGGSGTAAPQVQIYAQIVDAVGKILASKDPNEAAHVNAAAYAYYIKGIDLYRQRDWRSAETELQEAVRTAPNFAQAWSALAVARWREAVTTLNERRNTYKSAAALSARAAAQRALTLNPHESQAMGVLALLMPPSHLIKIDRQLEKALREMPHNPQLLEWHGTFLMLVGRNHDALDELTRAYELDRATPSAILNLVVACLKTGHFDVAKEILTRDGAGTDIYSREMSLRLHVKYFLYMRDWFRLGDYLHTLPEGLPYRTNVFLGLVHETAIALATRETEKYSTLKVKWRTQAPTDIDDATQVLFALGDTEGALHVIEDAVKLREKDPLLSAPQWEALFDPNLVPMRRNPRLPALFAKWGLLSYWQTRGHWPDFVR